MVSLIIERNKFADLEYDLGKIDRLLHHQQEDQKKLVKLIEAETQKCEQLEKSKLLKFSNSKRKKVVLLLLNELRFQLSKQCKERAMVLTKLWNEYFNLLSEETNAMVKNKNNVCLSLVEEIK